MSDLEKQRKVAQQFCADNLQECCIELAVWQSTGLLRDGKIRELAVMFSFAGYSALKVAQAEVEHQAVAMIAAGKGL